MHNISNRQIIRNAGNAVTGVAYLTEAEITELFGGMDDPEP